MVIETPEYLIKPHPKVLVVDDEVFIKQTLGMMLKRLGCLVETASNGKIGVEMVEKAIINNDKYDLIFMDVNMPVMNGYDASRLIKEKVATPIVCISAQESLEHLMICKDLKIDEIINKPCNIRKLNDILSKYNLL